MPGFDGTGPGGMGPMTGGRRGFCNPYSAAYGATTYYGYGYGRGFGRGMGRGFGRGMGRGVGRGFGGRFYGSRWNYSYPMTAPRPNSYATPYAPYPYGW